MSELRTSWLVEWYFAASTANDVVMINRASKWISSVTHVRLILSHPETRNSSYDIYEYIKRQIFLAKFQQYLIRSQLFLCLVSTTSE